MYNTYLYALEVKPTIEKNSLPWNYWWNQSLLRKWSFPPTPAKRMWTNHTSTNPLQFEQKYFPKTKPQSPKTPRKPWPPKRCAMKTVAIEVLVRDIRGLSVRWGRCGFQQAHPGDSWDPARLYHSWRRHWNPKVGSWFLRWSSSHKWFWERRPAIVFQGLSIVTLFHYPVHLRRLEELLGMYWTFPPVKRCQDGLTPDGVEAISTAAIFLGQVSVSTKF